MTFSTATIQGYVNWVSDLTQTPSGKNVVNLLVSVPDKRNKENNETTGTTFKLSVWNEQAGNVLKYIKKNQIITASGQISIENFNQKNPLIRMDFASILDYGVSPEMRENYTKINLENVKTQPQITKQKISTRK